MSAPLATIPFFQYYTHLSSLSKTYSMQNKKSETLLTFLGILQCKYNGGVPENVDFLMAIPKASTKKVAVVLNSFGLYDHVGLGP